MLQCACVVRLIILIVLIPGAIGICLGCIAQLGHLQTTFVYFGYCNNRITFVAAEGQNWGFPTYDWPEMAKDDYAWWRQRLSVMAKYFHA